MIHSVPKTPVCSRMLSRLYLRTEFSSSNEDNFLYRTFHDIIKLADFPPNLFFVDRFLLKLRFVGHPTLCSYICMYCIYVLYTEINRKFRVPRKQGAHFLDARAQIQDS
jgi:hypothetical protein